ncbi:MAG: aminotransferase class I/II-fold pyridoxal phosphate-dependent enzyme [Arenicellales bacterium]|nr:aminotransferase class I/II-fold pyridoxal phosphate-dependent enzyme [Arenicellales bacterium]
MKNKKAKRTESIQPFYVMEVLAKAYRMEAEGRDVIHLEVGEPDFESPVEVVNAGCKALTSGRTKYTPALGIQSLRQAIADTYPKACKPEIERVAVTPGSSGALMLAFGVLIDAGDEVLLADPGYPCNSNFIRLYGGEPKLVPVDASSNYQLTADLIRRNWTSKTQAVLIASPSNPTGTIISPSEMTAVVNTVEELGGVCIVDEIYHGLTYDVEIRTALHDSDNVFIINSFSKYFGMTGWRIGWLVSPDTYVDEVNKFAQNLYISTSAPAQYAAVSALTEPVLAECERRRLMFKERRDYLVPALRDIGFDIPVIPQGAFYVYAGISEFSQDSEKFALDVLEQTGVAITPGRDFGNYRHLHHVRFSYANTLERLQTAVSRLESYIENI